MFPRLPIVFALSMSCSCAAPDGIFLGEYNEDQIKQSGDTTTLSKANSIDTAAELFTSADGVLYVTINTFALFSCAVPMVGTIVSGFELESEISCENDQTFVDEDSGTGRSFSETKVESATATVSDNALTFSWTGIETFDFGSRIVFTVEGSFEGER